MREGGNGDTLTRGEGVGWLVSYASSLLSQKAYLLLPFCDQDEPPEACAGSLGEDCDEGGSPSLPYPLSILVRIDWRGGTSPTLSKDIDSCGCALSRERGEAVGELCPFLVTRQHY